MKKILWAVALLGWSGAQAAVYTKVALEQSTLTFVAKQMGVSSQGRFPKFTVKALYDTQDLKKSKVDATVDMATIDAGSDEANTEVKGKNWLNISKFPTATFVSDSLQQIAGKLVIKGKLTLKDKTQAVEVPVTVSEKGDSATFDGQFQVKRSQFALGEGEWADPSTVADEIQVKLHLVLQSK